MAAKSERKKRNRTVTSAGPRLATPPTEALRIFDPESAREAMGHRTVGTVGTPEQHAYGRSRLWSADVRRVPRREPIADTTIGNILQQALEIEVGRWTQADQNRVSNVLKNWDWQRYQRRDGELRQWRWREVAESAGGNGGGRAPKQTRP